MAEQQSDPILRVHQVLQECGLSHSPFYELRKRWDNGSPEPDGFPAPDVYLNSGRTPGWLLSTVLRWKAALLEKSRARRQARRQG